MAPHILVVEDSELVTGAFRILLEDAGYRMSATGTLEDAIAIAGSERVDVMLLDLYLPDGDGLAALGRLRELGALPGVTIAMTGDDEPATRVRCMQAGCDDVLIKPVSIAELRSVIAQHLP